MSAEPAPVQAFGRPMRGPSALGGDGRRFFHLTWTLAVTDFKLKFFGSVLGYVWQLLRPLLLFGVLLLVFTKFVKLGSGPQYPVILLMDIVLYTFFADATAGAISSLVDRENLVRKVQFPRMVVPLAVVLVAYFNLLLNLVPVLVFALARGLTPRVSWLEFPLLLVLLGIFATGIAMIVSALYVRFRDVRPIWEVALQALFYASPVIYTIDKIANDHRSFAKLIMFNPLAVILTQARRAVVRDLPQAQSAAQAIGGYAKLAVPIGTVFVVFALGFWLFNREAPRIAEQL